MIDVLYGIIIFIILFVLVHLVLFLIFKRNFVPVLMYHRITGVKKQEDIRYQLHKGAMLDLDTMKVDPKVFDKQMEFLFKKGYITQHLDSDTLVKKNGYVYLTFDDGYYDNYENALPILKQYNMKATFFLTAGLIEKGDYMPIDQNDKIEVNRLLSWSEAKTLAMEDMQLGAHTLNHHWLTGEDVNLDHEIVDSKLLIEKRTGFLVNVFAYPGGLYNDRALEYVQDNYSCAVITSRGRDFSSFNKNQYLIERETISSRDSLFMFKLKLFGVHKFIRKLWWLNGLRRAIKWVLKR